MLLSHSTAGFCCVKQLEGGAEEGRGAAPTEVRRAGLAATAGLGGRRPAGGRTGSGGFGRKTGSGGRGPLVGYLGSAGDKVRGTGH